MEDSYVTSQATIKCSCGDKCAKLTVYPDRSVFLTEKPMANISDHISMYNVAPFGKCHTTTFPPTGSATAANRGTLTPMPCVPGTVSEWLNGKSDYLVKGKPALLKSSYCRCQWGGIITITNDGEVDTGDADLSRQNKETQEEWETKEQEELLNDPEALLNGIQVALDIAGLFPGLGAIPDLLNAAIYAVRGDTVNAGLSLLAAVPGIGDAATAAKLAGKGVKAAKAAKKADKLKDNVKLGEKMDVESYNREELRRNRTKMAGIDPNSPCESKILYDTPESQTQSKFFELTNKKPVSAEGAPKPENGFSDLTKKDQWEIEKEQNWDNVKKSQEQSSWNPFTVKEKPNIPKSKVDSATPKKNHTPSPEDVLKDNKMNKYGDYKPKPDYSINEEKGKVGKKLDVNG